MWGCGTECGNQEGKDRIKYKFPTVPRSNLCKMSEKVEHEIRRIFLFSVTLFSFSNSCSPSTTPCAFSHSLSFSLAM